MDRYLEQLRKVDWPATVYELSDVSQADLRHLTAEGVASFAEAAGVVLRAAGVSTYRTAIYAPDDLPFGLARMYEMLSQNSPESVQVFRNRDEALSWLTG